MKESCIEVGVKHALSQSLRGLDLERAKWRGRAVERHLECRGVPVRRVDLAADTLRCTPFLSFSLSATHWCPPSPRARRFVAHALTQQACESWPTLFPFTALASPLPCFSHARLCDRSAPRIGEEERKTASLQVPSTLLVIPFSSCGSCCLRQQSGIGLCDVE